MFASCGQVTYLGGMLPRVMHIDVEVNARIAEADAAFGRLHVSIWDQGGALLGAELKVFRYVMLPALLYARGTVCQRLAKGLGCFRAGCLGQLLGIGCHDRISGAGVLKRAGVQDVRTLLRLPPLRWMRHIARVPGEHLPKRILYGEL